MNLFDLHFSEAVETSSGLFGIWRVSAFAHIVELGQWEDEVAESSALERKICAGSFVPINVGGDGAFQIAVRGVGSPGSLDGREREFLLVSSESYLLISGGHLALGGLEAVGSFGQNERVDIRLDPGRYAVVVHLVDWQAEPGMVESGGEPAPGALPDFIVEIYASPPGEVGHRTVIDTFDRP